MVLAVALSVHNNSRQDRWTIANGRLVRARAWHRLNIKTVGLLPPRLRLWICLHPEVFLFAFGAAPFLLFVGINFIMELSYLGAKQFGDGPDLPRRLIHVH